ncbi:hypothetical protein BH10PSE3_BH10PSE3_07500 [soil metagenome]
MTSASPAIRLDVGYRSFYASWTAYPVNEALGPAAGDIVVGSLSQARKHKRRFDAVITLEDPGCRSANKLRFNRHPSPAHLVLAFEDVDDDTLGVRVATQDQVAEALAFARAHSKGSLLVHCFHGVGRSAAIALAVMSDRLGPGNERAAIDRLLTIRPIATPNLVVVKLADNVLQRQGELVAAVAAWEAAAPGLKEKREARLRLVRTNPELYSWL